jgi:peptidoglycan biosynthesis protein MviN/MurJ (putative lipid II flippase)
MTEPPMTELPLTEQPLVTARGTARLARAAGFLAVTTVGSRALGLVREIVVAALFGASDAKAAYVIGY